MPAVTAGTRTGTVTGAGAGAGSGVVVSSVIPDPRRAAAVRIEVDGRPMWTVARQAVEAEGLAEGTVLDDELSERLERAADEEAALRTALRALERRAFARQDLARRLVRKGHPAAAVEAAMERVDALGLLDDRAFAEQYVYFKARRGQGPRRLLADLRRLGVAEDVAAAAVATVFPAERDLSEVIRQLAHKRARQLGAVSLPVKRRRIMSYLARRGYPTAEAAAEVDRVLGGSLDGRGTRGAGAFDPVP